MLFPQVDDIAVSRSVFGSVASSRLDTVNVALVKYNRPMTDEQSEKFRAYLRARLGLRSVSVIDVGSSVNLKRVNTPRK